MSREPSVVAGEDQFVDVNGIRMYYDVYGAGEPLVYLHGYTTNARQFAPFVNHFAEHYQVITPDERGHGRTLDPSYSYTLKQSADDVTALLDSLGIERFKAIGCSAGGCMLQYIASEQPDRVGDLILESTGHYFVQQTVTELLSWVDTPDGELEPKQARHVEGLTQLRALMNRLPALVEDYNAHPPQIERIKSHTLIAIGDRDALYPLSVAMDMYSKIADSTLWVVPNADHPCVFTEPPTLVDEFVRNALRHFEYDEQ